MQLGNCLQHFPRPCRFILCRQGHPLFVQDFRFVCRKAPLVIRGLFVQTDTGIVLKKHMNKMGRTFVRPRFYLAQCTQIN